ncbi:N-acetyltransferase [Gemmobacter nanjingensis]|uniref:N-acetyltransferase n=1 Tax=Gemmobacter nanjingensis TaxID=488454 RepID=A0ABQ3F9D5_9RHOB|nr:GNAT family N-acetyltransferase [Gemmobacter nanjingensis]GHC14589.1 N-acetyltransferase [Gemmobacter nanjingensis]
MIRPTCAADLEPIRAFWNPLIRDTAVTFSSEEKTETAMREYHATRIAAGHGFFTALAEGRPVGFATYGQFRGGNGYARSMEHTVILSDTARGHGFGRALMQEVEDHARAAGHHIMVAGVSSGNPAGRDFHAALGYRLVGTVSEAGWKFGRYWDLWLMQKILT